MCANELCWGDLTSIESRSRSLMKSTSRSHTHTQGEWLIDRQWRRAERERESKVSKLAPSSIFLGLFDLISFSFEWELLLVRQSANGLLNILGDWIFNIRRRHTQFLVSQPAIGWEKRVRTLERVWWVWEESFWIDEVFVCLQKDKSGCCQSAGDGLFLLG